MSDTSTISPPDLQDVSRANEVTNQSLLNAINSLKNRVDNNFDELTDKLGIGLQKTIDDINQSVEDNIQRSMNYFSEKFHDMDTSVSNLQYAVTSINNYIQNTLQTQLSQIQSGVNRAEEAVRNLQNNISDMIEGLKSQLRDEFKAGFDKITDLQNTNTKLLQGQISQSADKISKDMQANTDIINDSIFNTETRLQTSIDKISVDIQNSIDTNQTKVIESIDKSKTEITSNIDKIQEELTQQNIDQQNFISGVVDDIFNWINSAFSTDPDIIAPVLENYMNAQNIAVQRFMTKHKGG